MKEDQGQGNSSSQYFSRMPIPILLTKTEMRQRPKNVFPNRTYLSNERVRGHGIYLNTVMPFFFSGIED
jgi:hypothetical protein